MKNDVFWKGKSFLVH